MFRFWARRADDAAGPRDGASAVLDRRIRLSRLALAWERIWPALWPPLGLVGAIAATALFGLWGTLPDWAHVAGLAAALIGLGITLAPVLRFRWPTRGEARARLDASSASGHRPATGFEDKLAGKPGAQTVALWEAHRRLLAREASRLRVHLPSPRLMVRDPWALRAAIVLVLAVGVFYAGPDWRGRIVEAVVPVDVSSGNPLRLDAWITPPVYTGKAPIFLADGSETLAAVTAPEEPIEIPVGSELVLRFHGERGAEATLIPDDGDPQIFAYAGDGEAPELKSVIEGDAVLEIPRPDGDSMLSWSFAALADEKPEIEFAEDLTTTRDQALRLVYSIKDDYGVVGADVRFAHSEPDAEAEPVSPATAGGAAAPQMEIEPPDFSLVLPGVRVREATKEMFRDLTAHPWAGLEVTVTLVARDEAGQEGRSDQVTVTLPERRFINPLARAVIEERRNLVRRPESHERVARALIALTIAPELFIEDTTVYLGLRAAYLRAARLRTDEDLHEVVNLMWDVALRIEDGDLSLAERELRAAQEALARALAEGASDEEIAELMNELRQALARFMDALREQASQLGELPEIDSEMLETRDLSRMLDMIEQLARSGARDAAQQLLAQLQNLLENLDGARMGQMSPEQTLMSELLDELGRMIGEQQRLMDETYRQGQQQGEGGEQPGQMPMPGQRGEQGEFGEFGGSPMGRGEMQGRSNRPGELGPGSGPTDMMSLADQQKALREALEALRDQLGEGGIQAPNPLDRAGREMGEAEEDLRAGDNNNAVGDQREALDQLRQGAQSMAQQLAEGMTPGSGPGEPGPSARNGLTDPLGRPMRSTGPEFGLTVKVPDEIDAEAARRLRQELQRRLGDQFRRTLELDYIERLLELF